MNTSTIAASDFLDGDVELLSGALDLSVGWPSELHRDGRGVRSVTLSPGAPSRLVRADTCHLGVLDGRFLFRAVGDDAAALIGPGEIIAVPPTGLDIELVTGRPDGRFVLLFEGDEPQVLDGEGRPPLHGDSELAVDYYYGYADRYEEVYRRGATSWEPLEPNEILLAVLDRLALPVGRVIDLGCGEGRDSLHLAALGWDVLGVDVSNAALELARRRAVDEGRPARFLERDITALRGIGDDQFDLALNMGSLHMIPDPLSRARALSRFADVLRPGGVFVLAHCREGWLQGFWSVPDAAAVGPVRPGDVIERRIRTENGDTMVPLVVIPYHEASEAALAEECVAAGFEVVDVVGVDAAAFGSTAVLILRKPDRS